jgi:hypothetical protein
VTKRVVEENYKKRYQGRRQRLVLNSVVNEDPSVKNLE